MKAEVRAKDETIQRLKEQVQSSRESFEQRITDLEKQLELTKEALDEERQSNAESHVS